MTIHSTVPFATPGEARSPLRRFRGRLPSAVTLWTAYGRDDRPAGLTVSSTVVVLGDPGHLLGVLDEESSLWEAAQVSGRVAVMPLSTGDSQLADKLAGLMLAPGGAFATGGWTQTEYGPVLDRAVAWVGGRVGEVRAVGWSLLVDVVVEHIEVRSDDEVVPLIHYRGRYLGAGPPPRG